MKPRLLGLLIVAMVLLSACIHGPIYGDAAIPTIVDNRLDEAVRVRVQVTRTDGSGYTTEGDEVPPQSVRDLGPLLLTGVENVRVHVTTVSTDRAVLERQISRQELDASGKKMTIVIGP